MENVIRTLSENVFKGKTDLIFLVLLFMFLVGCMLGYGLEVLFRRFFSAKRWVNPGFMKGPWLPLYGFGLVLMFVLSGLFYDFLPKSIALYNPNGDLFGKGIAYGPQVGDLIPICTIGIGMTLLEFLAGLIFVKGFKVRLWDYSNMKGNVMGIVCPLFSIIWFAIAVLYYYAINPYVYTATKEAYAFMFGDSVGGKAANFLFIFFLGVAFGIMLIDFVTSANLFSKIAKSTKESAIAVRYEHLKEEQKKAKEELKTKFYDSLPEVIKTKVETVQAKKGQPSGINHFFRTVFLINPDKKKDTSSNYDEKGRPIKEEEEKVK